jgi:protein gp37
MAAAQQHTFQVLTKRPRRLARLLSSNAFGDAVQRRIDQMVSDRSSRLQIQIREQLLLRRRARLPLCEWPLPNIWIGTSIESEAYCWRADEVRHPHRSGSCRWNRYSGRCHHSTWQSTG